MDKQPTQIPEEITAEPKEAVKEAPTSEVVLPDEFGPLYENELTRTSWCNRFPVPGGGGRTS
jgi:hypothetical protein